MFLSFPPSSFALKSIHGAIFLSSVDAILNNSRFDEDEVVIAQIKLIITFTLSQTKFTVKQETKSKKENKS